MISRIIVFFALLLTAGCKDDAPKTVWSPGVRYPTPTEANERGFFERRGIIHAHSYFSHDACDNEPVKDGMRDENCFNSFRDGLCRTKQDFVFITDHPSDFENQTFEDALLHRSDRGDELITRGGTPTASWVSCDDGRRVLVMAGFENETMAVGLEGHVPPALRQQAYHSASAAGVDAIKQSNAVSLIAHTENWTPQELIDLPLDGFEMFNLHANAVRSAGTILELIVNASEHPERLPHPDLIFIPMFTEDPVYLKTWGSVLARGARKVTVMGTDCHENSFPTVMPDGERGDSYRRMMSWFSNHILVRPLEDGSWTDLELKDALRTGRVFGVFEAMGSPQDFDYFASAQSQITEMGQVVELSRSPVLTVKRPQLRALDELRTPPKITVRLLKAVEGGFEQIESSELGDLTVTVTSTGAYRAEVRMVPLHLRQDLGSYGGRASEFDMVWIYSNPIYVR